MRINTNMSSLIGWRNMSGVDRGLTKSLERLSSGLRINRAGDDVAGLGISENMRAQIRGLNQAVKNVQDGTSLIQTAEASLNEVHTILQRMRELSLQAANGTLGTSDRISIQTEMDQAAAEITRLTANTQFNSKHLLDGSMTELTTGDLALQVGSNQGQLVTVEVGAMDAASLGIARDVLTGTVDNGSMLTGDLSTTNRVHTQVHAAGDGLATGKYKLAFSSPPDLVQLTDANDQTIGLAVPYDPTADRITVGDPETNRTVTFKPAAWVQDGDTDVIVIRERTNAVQAVQEVGAGLTAGAYSVRYSSADQTMQLFAGPTQPIGVPVKVKAGETVMLGDPATARTVNLRLEEPLPSEDTEDRLTIGSPVGRVTSTLPQPRPILHQNPQGVVSVGAGAIPGATYEVFYDAKTDRVQLRRGGADVGGPVAFAPGAVVTLGDGVTGETLQVRLATERSPLSAGAEVTVTRSPAIDNGLPAFALGSNSIAASIQSVGTGMGDTPYEIYYFADTNEVVLQDMLTEIGPRVKVDPTQLTMTIGHTGSGRTVTFTLQTPLPATNNADALAISNWHEGVASIITSGPNLTAASYQITYDSVNEELQLRDSGGAAIGSPVAAVAGSVVTIGDGVTGETVRVRLKGVLPTGDWTDTLVVDSARTVTDPAGWTNNWIVPPGSTMLDIGIEMQSGSYRVAYDKSTNTVVLQDDKGQRIGGPVAVPPYVSGPLPTVTLGDPSTNRTVTVQVGDSQFAESFYQEIEIVNNGGKAHGATFEGGVRSLEAAAKGGLNVSSADAAKAALQRIDAAIQKVTDQRAELGAVQNRLEHTAQNLQVVSENLVAAESRLRDVDMAQEVSEMTKKQMLSQAAASLLAQANQKQQAVLQLLKGQ